MKDDHAARQTVRSPALATGSGAPTTVDRFSEALLYDGATGSEVIAASLAGGIVSARNTTVTPEEAYAVYEWVYALVRKKRGKA